MTRDEIAMHVRNSMQSFRANLKNDPALKAEFEKDPIKVFLDSTPKEFQDQFSPSKRELLRSMMTTGNPKASSQYFVQGSFWDGVQCYACEVGLNAGIIAAFAGIFAITAGAAVAPLIAAEAGFIPVIAAMTGLSETAVGTIATVGTVTIEGLIQGLCSEMGACS